MGQALRQQDLGEFAATAVVLSEADTAKMLGYLEQKWALED